MLNSLTLFVLFGAALQEFSPVEGIIGGHDTTINRHPVQLSLQHDGVHFCGGALVELQWVLTSGQCASKYFDLKIRAGSNYTTNGGELYDVERIFIHPSFNKQTLDADLALLKLTENVTANHTDKAWLPRSTDTIEEDSLVYLTGWGFNSSDHTLPDILQFAQVPANTLSQCRLKYTDRIVTENMLCAGYDKRSISSCDGDYGGPVIIFARLAGIQSWGGACGDVGRPTVFVNVARFSSWINETIQSNK